MPSRWDQLRLRQKVGGLPTATCLLKVIVKKACLRALPVESSSLNTFTRLVYDDGYEMGACHSWFYRVFTRLLRNIHSVELPDFDWLILIGWCKCKTNADVCGFGCRCLVVDMRSCMNRWDADELRIFCGCCLLLQRFIFTKVIFCSLWYLDHQFLSFGRVCATLLSYCTDIILKTLKPQPH